MNRGGLCVRTLNDGSTIARRNYNHSEMSEMTTFAIEMMLKFCDLSLKTIYITQKHKKNLHICKCCLWECDGKKYTDKTRSRKLHTFFITSFKIVWWWCDDDVVVVVFLCCPESKINFALKLYLHLSTSFIRLAPAFRVALSQCKLIEWTRQWKTHSQYMYMCINNRVQIKHQFRSNEKRCKLIETTIFSRGIREAHHMHVSL